MDQIKIGGFIAEERKRKGYTQKIHSEKLGIVIRQFLNGNGVFEL